MPTSEDDEHDDLPPPGSRSGAGAQSVLPYLTKSLQARPSVSAETREARAREENAGGKPHPGLRTS